MRRSVVCCGSSVLCKDYPHARLITLNNPKSMNALNYDMVQELHDLYFAKPAPASSLYVIKGAGTKAFCAGGDVIGVTTNTPPGCGRNFFYWQYQMDHKVYEIPAGQVALWDGYVMGGGVGLSFGSRYRVATEKACFAMPEAAIGMIPDVGGSWFLPRLPFPGLGLFMGLTGHRIRGADLVHLGFASHFVPSEKIGQLEEDLCALSDAAEVVKVLEKYTVQPAQLPPCTLAPSLPFLRDHFAIDEQQNLPAIVQACRAHADKNSLAKAAADVIPTYSPTAMVLALEVLRRGSKLRSIIEAFQMEYCATQRVLVEHDFREGVRALLIDKDKQPKWKPSTFEEVTKESIEAYFHPTHPDQMVWDPVKPPTSATQ
ncbi:putative mitochondrial enoyl-CoA hydratase/isomerase family protein [Leptomonas pyrrhocoris]|uniref:3-hydroxyisobutyryl-CoA hydrolase n=1 Tax=Leptomonas pyrrhocoris TaxID=157538 RepID=A0A0M9G8R9_LEPPY|nr:putative mitochondrial enoyl-CoA hydratase/isomerase family protein [Leptomonas pyrrhocoris]XP_015663452.1 putative mitochondrial enoyl-CoA hydratase/isomerase family protein [Leptomonas pyrrhocoris]XP_015663453.1 putative mitochondrial enoyl-CoA hydratase/isomerase family protein [Leptomonas pyrrhocoris]KPA85012.1 putative mitochondrial enoyl-CoA hydratase/isomerase family protein [Leptomonas pyrrhocoris]KPA85013.1 putative mitochondrial enoyl-CoA hydratase/isomerase family protein [Leptomo|eukprot:XP_015663451.1 putative mitochondrial enoyl-CoA hydratase/isomerase family protein [Leptomonas pyrrhocoris]